jgi:hypothetical protein
LDNFFLNVCGAIWTFLGLTKGLCHHPDNFGGVKLVEYIISRHFRAVPQAMATFQIGQFTHLPSMFFLCLLDESPTTLIGSHNLWISQADGNQFDKLQGKVQNLTLALKNINSRARRETDSEDET